jgi:hypothetical protein
VAGAAEDSGPACRDASEAVGLSKFRVMAAEAEPGPAALKTPSAPAEPGAPDRVRVRAAPGQDDPEADAAGAAALGRIAIVRQKGEGARNLLARLLSSF